MDKHNIPQKCPRCESAKPQILSYSPVKDAWVIYHCPTCFFNWRNTEPSDITDPEKYNYHFKYKPDDIKNFDIMPAIPELKK